MLRLTLVAALAAALSPSLAAAETRSVSVSASAVDFDARVARAARDVCGPVRDGLQERSIVRACRAQAISNAREQRQALLNGSARMAVAAASATGGQN